MNPADLSPPRSPSYPCPCCGYLSFPAPPGSDAICTICLWWDDLEQLRFPTQRDGANPTSLLEAQANFRAFGAADLTLRTYARPPRPEDRRDPEWRPLDPLYPIEREAGDLARPSGANPENPAALYYWRGRAGKQSA